MGLVTYIDWPIPLSVHYAPTVMQLPIPVMQVKSVREYSSLPRWNPESVRFGQVDDSLWFATWQSSERRMSQQQLFTSCSTV